MTASDAFSDSEPVTAAFTGTRCHTLHFHAPWSVACEWVDARDAAIPAPEVRVSIANCLLVRTPCLALLAHDGTADLAASVFKVEVILEVRHGSPVVLCCDCLSVPVASDELPLFSQSKAPRPVSVEALPMAPTSAPHFVWAIPRAKKAATDKSADALVPLARYCVRLWYRAADESESRCVLADSPRCCTPWSDIVTTRPEQCVDVLTLAS